MDETTNPIVGWHTHGVYNGYGRNDGDGILVDLINKNDLNSSIRDVGRDVSLLAKGQSDNTIATAGLITDLGRDVTDGVHNTMVQTLNSFNQLDKTVANGTGLLIGQGQNILAELARCCCELKERFAETDKLILIENQATRALITDNRMHDLEDELSQSRLKFSQAEQTAAIIAALKK